MQITQSSADAIKGPGDWFTGDVYIDAVAAAPALAGDGQSGALHARCPHPLASAPVEPDRLRHRGRRTLPTARRPAEVIKPGDRVLFEADEEYTATPAEN